MTSALLGLTFIVLIALVSVALGALTRLLAVRLVRADPCEHRDLTAADRIALGNEMIARDLQPDSIHPVARTAAHHTGADLIHDLMHRPELAMRHPRSAARALR